MTKDRVILGIDPGTIVMGYGALKIEGHKPKLEAMGILQLNKYEDHYLRLRKIFERVLGLIDSIIRTNWPSKLRFSGRTYRVC